MTDFRSEFVTVANLPTHLLIGGQGPPLVYLHGVAPAGGWMPVHDRLAEQFTVYAPDHPGFGLTERPEWLEGMDDLVLHYDALFRLLDLVSPRLVGYSLGGWLAAAFAVTYPDRIDDLVLLNAAGLHLDEAVIPDLPALRGEALARTVFYDQATAAAYFTAGDDPEERLRRYRAMTTLSLLAWNPWFDPRLQRRLRRITARTLLLWAERDELIKPIYGEAYRDAIPGAQLEILPGCGHMAPVEQPGAVADAICRFLSAGGRPGEEAR